MGSGDGAPGLVPATRRQRMLAGVVDLALGGVGVGLLWQRLVPEGARARSPWSLAAIALTRSILEEQIGSPGARVAGIRTVDRRTGRRVDLWRTLVLAGAVVAGQTLGRRVQGGRVQAIVDPEHEARERELHDIGIRFADDPDGRMAAVRDYYMERGSPAAVNITLPVVTIVVAGLINHRLRRRLAPTMLVSRRG
jgi:hypothetical protein